MDDAAEIQVGDYVLGGVSRRTGDRSYNGSLLRVLAVDGNHVVVQVAYEKSGTAWLWGDKPIVLDLDEIPMRAARPETVQALLRITQ